MNNVPIVFAFDNNLILPACVCLYSLLKNAHEDTYYDIFILHSRKVTLDKDAINKLNNCFSNFKIQYRLVDDTFDNAFEIRGITTSTYYRLLIPELVPEYDKIIYSDVDVIFRGDLHDVYADTNFTDQYVAGVNALASEISDMRKYYENNIKDIDSDRIIYAGNIILNSQRIRENNLVHKFKELAKNNYRFQDLDVLNIACRDNILYMNPAFCLTTYFYQLAIENRNILLRYWSDSEVEDALRNGIVHYNGQKPWKGYCINFDIWWEYYRKSPFFDEKYYFEFFYNRLNELDQLPLIKRIKILVRYFVYGKRKI